jgi:hypothetical protein
MDVGGDTQALIRLKVACDLAIAAADDLGRPLQDRLARQIRELCDAIQQELEGRDERFADLPGAPEATVGGGASPGSE